MAERCGMDVGGTSIKAGLVDGEGRVVGRLSLPSDVGLGVEAIEARIGEAFAKLGGASRFPGLGIGVPGIVDEEAGTVRLSPNVPCWRDYPVRERLASRLGVEVRVENDANCAALGEGLAGAGRGIPSFLLLTLGTGVGGGVVLAGRIWRGDSGRGGELGHIVVDPDGEPCGCGGRGCLETVASASGIARLARRAGLGGGVEELASRARAGGGDERRVFEQAGRALGIAVADLLNVLDVHTIIVGGGVSAALDLMLPALVAEAVPRAYAIDPASLRVLPATLGEDAGIVGAAGLVT